MSTYEICSRIEEYYFSINHTQKQCYAQLSITVGQLHSTCQPDNTCKRHAMYYSNSVSQFLQRFVYPLVILGCLTRPVLLALPYMGLLFWLPYVPVAQPPVAMPRRTRIFLLTAIAMPTIVIAAQSLFLLLTVKNVIVVGSCDTNELLLLLIGFKYTNEFQ